MKSYEIVLGAGIATAGWTLVQLLLNGDPTSIPSADSGQVQALAAKQMVWLTVTQITLALAGTAGLILTLVYTRRTADAGIAAARAADHSTKLAERTFADLERPYLFIFGASSIRHDYSRDEEFEWIPYSVANYGKVPAIIEHAQEIVTVGTWPEPPLLVDNSHSLRTLPVLAAGEKREKLSIGIAHDNLIRVERDYYGNEFASPKNDIGGDFLVHILIRYRGPFTRSHETSACWRWDRISNSLVLYGGTDLNYEK